MKNNPWFSSIKKKTIELKRCFKCKSTAAICNTSDGDIFVGCSNPSCKNRGASYFSIEDNDQYVLEFFAVSSWNSIN